jgi:hypothetical protein
MWGHANSHTSAERVAEICVYLWKLEPRTSSEKAGMHPRSAIRADGTSVLPQGPLSFKQKFGISILFDCGIEAGW